MPVDIPLSATSLAASSFLVFPAAVSPLQLEPVHRLIYLIGKRWPIFVYAGWRCMTSPKRSTDFLD